MVSIREEIVRMHRGGKASDMKITVFSEYSVVITGQRTPTPSDNEADARTSISRSRLIPQCL